MGCSKPFSTWARGSESLKPDPIPSSVSRLTSISAALASRADSRGNVHALPAVIREVGVRVERPSGVCSDPDVRRHDLGIECPLNRDGSLDRCLRIVERREEAVAGPLDHLSAALDDPLADQLVVAREQPLPLFCAERLEQLGRIDDVGEDEGAARFEPAQKLLRALLVQLGTQTLEYRQRG